MKRYLIILLATLAANLSAQIPSVEHKHVRAIVSYEFEGEKDLLFNDSAIIACPIKTVVLTPNERIFLDSRETNNSILREYPALEDDLDKKGTYLDNSPFYAFACRDEAIDKKALVYDCDSILIEYHKRNVDHSIYFSRDWIHGYDRIYSQHIYTNESGNFEIVFGIEMMCMVYSNVDLFLREKNEYDQESHPQPPKDECCPFPEVSDHLIVVDEIYGYFQIGNTDIESRKLGKSTVENIYIPLAY